MDEPTKAPSSTPIRWIDPGADAVRRPTFSLADPIQGRRSVEINFDVPIPAQTFSLDRLLGQLVKLDDGREVGIVTFRSVDFRAGTLRLGVTLPDMTIDELRGHHLVIPLVEVQVIEREPLRIGLGVIDTGVRATIVDDDAG